MNQTTIPATTQKKEGMVLFNRVLIAADLSDMDDQLFAFVKNMLANTGVEKIYPIHIIPDFTKPQKPALDFHQRFSIGYPVDEKVKDLLKEKTNNYFSDSKMVINIEVVEGKPYRKLLHMAEVKEVSLVVVGVKSKTTHSGITSKRLARHLECNLLLVPEEGVFSIDKLIVPIDFSDNSAKALLFAHELRKTINPQMKVEAIHMVNTLSSAHYYAMTENPEYKQLLKEAAEKKYTEFIKKYQINSEQLTIKYIEDDLNHPAALIDSYARKSPHAMLVMGAKGHGSIGSFFFGSVAESIVNQIKSYPVLIVR